MASEVRRARARGAAEGGGVTLLGAVALEALGVWERTMEPADGHQEAYQALLKVTQSCVELLNAISPGGLPPGAGG